MKEWKYLVGSADDFIGAPEWALVKVKDDFGSYWLEKFEVGSKAREIAPPQEELNVRFIRPECKLIAERTESFGNAIDLEFCKANPDHPDCKCKGGFLNNAFKQSEGAVKAAIADSILNKHETYTIDIGEPKVADTNNGTLTYKVGLDLSELSGQSEALVDALRNFKVNVVNNSSDSVDLQVSIDDEVATTYYNKRAAYLAKKNKYARICKGMPVDVYDVLQAFAVTNPATQHAIKKLLCAGLRGHKDKMQDLTEALKSIERAIELEKE